MIDTELLISWNKRYLVPIAKRTIMTETLVTFVSSVIHIYIYIYMYIYIHVTVMYKVNFNSAVDPLCIPSRVLTRLRLWCGQMIRSTLRWRHNEWDGVWNHQPHDCLLNCFSGRRSKKISKPWVTGLCAGNSPGTGEFPAQMVSNAETVSIWWRHHDMVLCDVLLIHAVTLMVV